MFTTVWNHENLSGNHNSMEVEEFVLRFVSAYARPMIIFGCGMLMLMLNVILFGAC